MSITAQGRGGHAAVRHKRRFQRCSSNNTFQEALQPNATGWQSLEHELLWRVGCSALVLWYDRGLQTITQLPITLLWAGYRD